jgi:hypothetical protein
MCVLHTTKIVARKKTRHRKLHPRVELPAEEEEKIICKMLDDGYTFPEIAEVKHKSISTIQEINDRRKASRAPKQKTKRTQAISLFKQGKSILDVVTEVDMDPEEAETSLVYFWRLSHIDILIRIYMEQGPSLPFFYQFYKDLQARGLTMDQVLALRPLASHYSQLEQDYKFLNSQVAIMRDTANNLSIIIGQSRIDNDRLGEEIASKRKQSQELSALIANWESIMNSIRQGEISYCHIDRIAKEVGKSLIVSRLDSLATALVATIQVLKKDPTLTALFLAPFPGLQYLQLQSTFIKLATEVWDTMSDQVNIGLMTTLFERAKLVVEELKIQEKPNIIPASSTLTSDINYTQVRSTVASEQTHSGEMSKFQPESNMKIADLSEPSSHARRPLPRMWPMMKEYYDLWIKYPIREWYLLPFVFR